MNLTLLLNSVIQYISFLYCKTKNRLFFPNILLSDPNWYLNLKWKTLLCLTVTETDAKRFAGTGLISVVIRKHSYLQ